MILQWTLDVSDKPSCSRFALLIPSKILPCILQSPFYLLNTFFLCCSFSSSCIIFLSFAPSSSLYTSLFALVIRKILALRVCPSSSSLPRHYSPFALFLSLSFSLCFLILPLPPSAIRRVEWVRVTRWGGWLVSMETNQLCTGISRLNRRRRRLSRRAARRSFCEPMRYDTPVTSMRNRSSSSEFHGRRRRENGAVYFRTFCGSYFAPEGGKSAFVGGQESVNEEWKCFRWI